MITRQCVQLIVQIRRILQKLQFHHEINDLILIFCQCKSKARCPSFYNRWIMRKNKQVNPVFEQDAAVSFPEKKGQSGQDYLEI